LSHLNTTKSYRHILILESREWWDGCSAGFDPARDLVLTYDLALQRTVTNLGGQALYIDHLVDAQVMQLNNFHTYGFFKDWHFDADSEDIFTHRGIPFGFAFRIEIWNDLLSYVLNRSNLERLLELNYEQLFVGTESGLVESILAEIGISTTPVARPQIRERTTYYFPIQRWMDEKIRPKKFKSRIMRWFITSQGIVTSCVDRILEWRKNKTLVYFQFYHPTRKIFETLNQDPDVKLVLGHFTPARKVSKYLTERPIPISGATSRFAIDAERLMQAFQDKRHVKLILENSCDISDRVYAIIQKRIESRIQEYLRDLDFIIDYLDRHTPQLEVMIANIGRVNTLVDCVCKKRGIPSYLIINGLMVAEYLDESKYATVINAYSDNIKESYFRGMDNIVCLGDPRMDDYVTAATIRSVNRTCPTVTIGASGFNNIDLNSYVAIEFEFLWDVLHALQTIRKQGIELRVIIKVRPNGYREQYQAFSDEYFPSLVSEIQDIIPMRSVLEKTDLYISIYSQTLFEASCLGIPCIYHKNDTEIINAPFDGKSELVTTYDNSDLVKAIRDFIDGSDRYNLFLQKKVMEKYIGPLDGKNLKRNLTFIYDLLKTRRERNLF
jgi:hypothetical protein